MKKNIRPFILIALITFLAVGSGTRADNWAHWRGDHGNSVSENATPPTEWSDTKNVKWKVRVPGRGSGSPVIWEDKVYVVSGVPVSSETSET
ncbi:MAG: PQQ-binding-like beta-propeller repeat protein, partial [Fuerstiella sp.]